MLSEKTVGELNRLFGLGQATPARKLRYRWTCPVLAQEITRLLNNQRKFS